MTLFAEIFALVAALSIVAPEDGATVATLRGVQKAYLSAARSERHRVMTNATLRTVLMRRGASQQPLRLAWTGDTNGLYEVSVAREGGAAQTFTVPGRTETWLVNLEIGATYRWSVTDAESGEKASATFKTEPNAPRLLWAGGVLNFRDLGGWSGRDGRRVRQNMIFRSAGLTDNARAHGGMLAGGFKPGERRITAEGVETLRKEFKIKTEIDLRTRQETAGQTLSPLGADVALVHVPFVAYALINKPVRGREPFAEIFQTFLDRKNYPILFHCSGGRDRGGTLAFLLEGLLGVDDDALWRDWEATVFAEGDTAFEPRLLQGLTKYLRDYGGETFAERCEHYALSCGITKAQINTFREIMLEDAR